MGGKWRAPDNPCPLNVARVAHPPLRVAGGAEALRAYRRHNLFARMPLERRGRRVRLARLGRSAGGRTFREGSCPGGRVHHNPGSTTLQSSGAPDGVAEPALPVAGVARSLIDEDVLVRRLARPLDAVSVIPQLHLAALAGGDALLFAKVAHPAEEPEDGPLGDRAPRHRGDEDDELIQVEVPVVLLASLHNARLLLRCPPKLSRVVQEVEVA